MSIFKNRVALITGASGEIGKELAIELNKRGFGLARRTITKYRKKNNIPSSRHR